MADAPIPVVIAAPPMRTGGTEQHLLHILPELAKRGFAITVVLLAGGGALEPKLRALPVTVVSPPGDSGRGWRTFAQASAIRRAVKATGARVLHAFLSEPYFAAYAALRLPMAGAPALVHGRRSLAFYGDRRPIARFVERRLHHRAAMLVGNSTAVATELMAECRSAAKVAVIHNGIPLNGVTVAEERTRARTLFGIGSDELILAMVANFHAYKGHADLIEGLELALGDLPPRWRVLLPGRDGGALADLKALANRKGLGDRLILPGELDGSRTVYAAADIGLLVSHTEGFSNSLIEGMAAGLPMIATSVGGNLDAIIDGETGLLVPVRAPERLAEAIRLLASERSRRADMGTAARAAVETRFSLDACVSAYERLWRGLAARSRDS
jgi:glycosyltransferase involved in cell wall biosynthesis